MKIIGRKKEIHELQRLYDSKRPEFVAVYGRRRVGKTFLIKEFFNNDFTFYATGVAKGSRKEQLRNFYNVLQSYNATKKSNFKTFDWFAAFNMLKDIIIKSRQKRKIVFLDELPWMDTQKSEFIKALDLFWNSWASTQNELMLIVCGSAASWMVKKIIRNRGGLHNRITCRIHLHQFSLSETQEFLYSNGIHWDKSLVAECYMILGGIPYYLQYLDRAYSLAQNIDRLFFDDSAMLEDEFKNLYDSLFTHSDAHMKIVKALAQKKSGYTRAEIAKATLLAEGGSLTNKLEELEQCGFIRTFKVPKTRAIYYQLVDFYTLFHLQFQQTDYRQDNQVWMHMQNTTRYSNWLGLSFERLCFVHLSEIRKALGISGIATKTFAYSTNGAQIDMIIERSDKSVNLCEMKFTEGSYTITKSEMEKINNRVEAIREIYPKKSIFITMITSNGLTNNNYAINGIHSNITLDDLIQ